VVPRHGSSSGKVQETLQKGGFDATLHIPPEGNFLIAYSTMPHYQSYKLKGEGGIWSIVFPSGLRHNLPWRWEMNSGCIIDCWKSGDWKNFSVGFTENVLN